MSKVIVRLVSSEDHALSHDELVTQIRTLGTDRYDPDKTPIFNDFYVKHKIDFFGTMEEEDGLGAKLVHLKKEFAEKTLGDRGRLVTPDIAILYKPDQCEMIHGVYEGLIMSDCFRFRGKALDALQGVREI